jgi:hypothetical protein
MQTVGLDIPKAAVRAANAENYRKMAGLSPLLPMLCALAWIEWKTITASEIAARAKT